MALPVPGGRRHRPDDRLSAQRQAGQEGSQALLQACPRPEAHPQPARGRDRPPQELSRWALVQKCRFRAWGGAAAERYGATPSSAGRPMPYKFNEPRRHKIPRARYRVQNWPEYDRTLQRRGDLTVWVTPEAIAAWCPPRTGR